MLCGRALRSLAKVIEFVPAHAVATMQHPAVFIEKEGHYKTMQLTVSRSLNRRRAGTRKLEREQSLERGMRLERASMGISLCRRKVHGTSGMGQIQ